MTAGNAGRGIDPSTLTPDLINIPIAELINVVTAGGLTPSKTEHDQVLRAIRIIVAEEVAEAMDGVVSCPVGSVIFWNGTGTLNGVWAVCDGSNGTPNLIDVFLRGGWSVGATGGATSSTVTTTQAGGVAARRTGGTVLTVAQLARHKHPLGDKIVSDRGSGGVIESYDKFATGPSETEEVGDNEAHDHEIDAVDPHDHNVTVPTVPPFYSLIPILRIA